MARGDRRELIFLDDEDRRMFLGVLEEACGRTGWLCHAYVLMPNHYHLVIETPEPNLVAGMAWMQNTFTRRHNARHKLWGHLFGGRYKAVLVDADDALYLPTLIDYVHLNPVRAGLVRMEEGLETFAWSSLAACYVLPPSKRKPWLQAERGLRTRGFQDQATGRRHYLEHLERRAKLEGKEAGRGMPGEQSLPIHAATGLVLWLAGVQGEAVAVGRAGVEGEHEAKQPAAWRRSEGALGTTSEGLDRRGDDRVQTDPRFARSAALWR